MNLETSNRRVKLTLTLEIIEIKQRQKPIQDLKTKPLGRFVYIQKYYLSHNRSFRPIIPA